MPLHPDGEALTVGLHRLRDSVTIPSHDAEARMFFDSLMVMAGHRESTCNEFGDAPLTVDRHFCTAVPAGRAGMSGMAQNIGQMLKQRAACGDRHHLHPSADAEHR